MPIVKLRDIGSKGLIRDVVPHEVPDGWMTEALNVRFGSRGIMRWPTPKDVYTISGAQWMSSCQRGDGASMFYASQDKLWVTDGSGSFRDATGPALVPAEDWDAETYGQTMLFVSYSNVPQVIEKGDTNFRDLDNWPAGCYARVLRTYKNFFVAVGIQEGVDEKRNVVMWSDAAYNDGLPPNWDYADPTSLSGQATIAVGHGYLTDALEMGDQLILYTEGSATSMQFTGGQFTMAFRQLFKFGCMNRNCVVGFNRQHFVVGPNHIYVHDGVNIRDVAEGRVERAIYADMLDRNTVKVVANPASHEIMIYFQSNDPGNPYVAWVWNWTHDCWTRVQLAVGTRCLHYGPPESEQWLWTDYGTALTRTRAMPSLWSEETRSWSDLSGTRREHQLYEMTGTHIRQSFVNYDADTYQPFKVSRIQRLGIDLDALPDLSSENVKFIRRVYPIMTGEDTAQVRVRFGSSQSPDSDVTWTGWATHPVRNGIKVDTRVTGRYLAFEIEGSASQAGGWAITGLDLEIDTAGRR